MSLIKKKSGESKESKFHRDASILRFPKQWDQNLQSVEEAKLSFQNCDYFAKLLLPENQFIIKTRIGSPSQFANVYKVNIQINGYVQSICAVKAVLFVDDNKELFRKEHDIATELFAAFPKTFLRVFKYSEFENLVFPNANVMLEARKNVYEQSSAWKNTLSQLKKTDRTLYSKAKRTGPDPQSFESIHVPGGLLYSQLGVGDLKQCIQSNKFTEEMLMQFKQNVLEAIVAMHSKGIVHNDLHLGNVLVVWVDKALKAVIHDFDKSVYSTDVDRRKHDTETFLSHFEEAMNINI